MREHTEASAVIEASPAQVLEVISDFPNYPHWAQEVVSAEILETDAGGWARKVAFVLDAGMIKDSYVLRYNYDIAPDGSGVMSWELESAEVLAAMNGSYTLYPSTHGTEVTYSLEVNVHVPIIDALKRKAEATIIETALQGLARRITQTTAATEK